MRSQVQRSLFRVTFLSLTLSVGQQVLDKTTNGSTGASGMIIYILKLRFCYVLLIQCLLQSQLTNQRFRPARRTAGEFEVNPEPLNREPVNGYVNSLSVSAMAFRKAWHISSLISPMLAI